MRAPTNGGTNTWLSSATSGERAGIVDGSTSTLVRAGQVAPARLAAPVGIFVARSLDLAQAIHDAQTFERILAVEEAPFVDLA